jgi:hypothetical protein
LARSGSLIYSKPQVRFGRRFAFRVVGDYMGHLASIGFINSLMPAEEGVGNALALTFGRIETRFRGEFK